MAGGAANEAARGPGWGVLAGALKPRVRLPGPRHFPPVEPVPGDAERPFWSVMIPTYNRTRYLEETLRSVLAQDPGPARMQIEVVDNCSSEGGAQEIVERVGHGRVSFFRQPRNVPLHENWTTCIRRSRGQWVHLLHDDDAVLPGFYDTYERLITEHPGAALVTAPVIYIDESGRPMDTFYGLAAREGPIPDFTGRQAVINDLRTPSVAVARRVYEQTGGVCELLSHCADWEMFFRAGWVGTAVAAAEPLCLYRIHAGMDTNRAALSGRNVEEALLTVEMCFSRLSPEEQERLAPLRYSGIAAMAGGAALNLAAQKHFQASLRQATWELRLAPTGQSALRWVLAVMRLATRGHGPDRLVQRFRPSWRLPSQP